MKINAQFLKAGHQKLQKKKSAENEKKLPEEPKSVSESESTPELQMLLPK